MPLDVRAHGGTVRVQVHVQPRASRTELAGLTSRAKTVELEGITVEAVRAAAGI